MIRILLAALVLAGSAFAQSTPTFTVNTLNDLVQIAPSVAPMQTALVKGRLTATGSGGGIFFYQAASSVGTNAGTVVKPALTTGRWLRQYDGPIDVTWFGADPGDAVDDTAAIQAAINFAQTNAPVLKAVYMPGDKTGTSKYIVSSTLTIGVNVNSSVNLYGDGLYTTWILTTITDGTPTLLLDGVDGCTLRDFGIRTAVQNPATNRCVGIKSASGDRYQIERVYIQGCGIGAAFECASSNIGDIKDLVCRYNGLGVYADGWNNATTKIDLENNTVGFLVKNASSCQFNNWLVEDQVTSGGQFKNVNNSVWLGMYYEANGDYHVKYGVPEGLETGDSVRCSNISLIGGNCSNLTSTNSPVTFDYVTGVTVRGINIPNNTVRTGIEFTTNCAGIDYVSNKGESAWFTEDGATIKPAQNLAPDGEFLWYTNKYSGIVLANATHSQETANTRTMGKAVRFTATAATTRNRGWFDLPAYAVTALKGQTAFVSAWLYAPSIANYTSLSSQPAFGLLTDGTGGGTTVTAGIDFSLGRWNYVTITASVPSDATFVRPCVLVNNSDNAADGTEYLIIDSLFVGLANQSTNQIRNGNYSSQYGLVYGDNGVFGASYNLNGTNAPVNGIAVQGDVTTGAAINNVGEASPGVSGSGKSKIYFDSSLNKLMASENGGIYVPVISANAITNTASGTANAMAKFTGTNTIGNSLATDNGTVITLNEPLVGGTTTTSPLTLRSTSGVGTTGADIIFQAGNNGATEIVRMFNNGDMTIGSATDIGKLAIPVTAAASTAHGTISLGGGLWDGSGTAFIGAASGTHLAMNLSTASTVDPVHIQVAGVSKVQIDSSGDIKGAGYLSLGATASAPDVFLVRDGANNPAFRNGANALTLNVYNTFTDVSNYERGFVRWSGNKFQLGNEKGGSGIGSRSMEIIGMGGVFINGSSVNNWAVSTLGNFQPVTDATYTLGDASHRVNGVWSTALTLASSSLSANAPNNESQIWNSGGTTFNLHAFIITNTASSATSTFWTAELPAGTVKASLREDGTLTLGPAGFANLGLITEGGVSVGVGSIGAGTAGNQINLYVASANVASINSTGFQTKSTGLVTWGSGSTIGSADTSLERGNAGIVRTGTGTASTAATLSTAGLRLGILTKTTNYTTTIADHTILADATSSNLVVTLIASASAFATPNGNEFTVKKIDSTANTVTVQVSGGANIDGAATDVLTTQYQSHNYQADGTKYWIH